MHLQQFVKGLQARWFCLAGWT